MARARTPHGDGTGGGGDPTTTRRGSGDGDGSDGDGSSSRRRTRGGGDAQSVTRAQQSTSEAAQQGRPTNANQLSNGSSTTGGGGDGLPPGYTRDSDGRVRGPDGRYANDPNAIPRAHNRDTEYPSGYRQGTHDDLVTQYTDEGQAAGGVPRDAHGNRIPRDQLTWRDDQGREIPFDELTYEHLTPVVEHWNNEGYDMSQAERNDWYNDSENLVPMTRSENSRGGGAMTERYRQDTGSNYSK